MTQGSSPLRAKQQNQWKMELWGFMPWEPTSLWNYEFADVGYSWILVLVEETVNEWIPCAIMGTSW